MQIISKAKDEIAYLRYLKHSFEQKKEFGKVGMRRIRSNRKLFMFGKRNKQLNQVNREFPEKEQTLEYWRAIFQNGFEINDNEELV